MFAITRGPSRNPALRCDDEQRSFGDKGQHDEGLADAEPADDPVSCEQIRQHGIQGLLGIAWRPRHTIDAKEQVCQ